MSNSTDYWRTLTDAACRIGFDVWAPRRRRRAAQLRQEPLRRILVLHEVRGIGNTVLLSGLLRNLRRLFPQASISLAMPSCPTAESLLGPELVDELLFFDPSGERRALLAFARQVLRPRHFDLGLATFFSATLLTSCVLALAGCRYRIAFAETPTRGVLNTVTLVDQGGPELDRHLRLLEFAGQGLDRAVAVRGSAEASRAAREFFTTRGLGIRRPLLGIHPGCDRANALKRWPVERFAAVARRVVGEGWADVAVFVGPDEAELSRGFDSAESALQVVRADRLEEVSALIGQCQAFLSNDSGLMHVAAARGVPVVAIFGPTDTVKNAPVGSATLLTAPNVPCRPCYAGAPITCSRERRFCLEDIAEDTVVAAVARVLGVRAAAVSMPEDQPLGCVHHAV